MLYSLHRNIVLFAATVALAFGLGALMPAQALADSVTINIQGVSDYTTDLHVAKTDSYTGSYVKGAHFAIYLASDYDAAGGTSGISAVRDATTGKALDWWSTDGTVDFPKSLNVGTEYVLVELEAPTGYSVAAPTYFKIQGWGDGEVVLTRGDSDGDGEADDGHAARGDKQLLTIRDDATSTTLNTQVTRQGESTSTSEDKASTGVKTGDTTNILPFVAVALVAAIVAVVALVAARRRKG